ncbi:hypothetical protein PENSPDRAFT_747202 [Peniophora sp. CONT]|nr:hypothetical protein PENSPDRAFT_747202 [Peniophora sp. CONT]
MMASKLPAPPPANDYGPPPPPPKLEFEHSSDRGELPPMLPPIDASSSFDTLAPARTPNASPGPSPSSPSFPETRAKKANPLVDLIDTEKTYVEQLTGIIRKVASAWSRNNLPPKDLDLMFRSLESVYKANRSLVSRLKEIGTNPSSPKALGDLLMRWIDDLETPYTAYADRFCVGFDDWDLVRSNDRLPGILATFSEATPPPPSSTGEPAIWTLDQLFLLPKARLKYYKKLYGRLLKGTQPGRSDHKLLVAAAEKLERLLATVESRSTVLAGDGPRAPPRLQTEDEVVVDLRSAAKPLPPLSPGDGPTGSETSASARGSGISSANRHSEDTTGSVVDRPSSAPLQITIPELERRLSLARCMDIFTMTPKQVKLSLLPPSLPFARQVRCGTDARITFVPRATGVEVHHPRARIFVLSDLFLACELDAPDGEQDMYLLYPPLAGKFLKVTPVEGSATQLHLSVMKKEKLTIEVANPQLRDQLVAEFTECIGFAAATHSASKHPMPALPPLGGLPQRPGAGPNMSSSQSVPTLGSAQSPPPSRISSPPVTSPTGSMSQHSGSGTFSPPRFGSPASDESSDRERSRSIADSMSRFADAPGPQRQPTVDGRGMPQRSSSQATYDDGRQRRMSPPGPGQIMPSFTPGQVMPGSGFGPGQVMPGNGFGPGQIMPSGSFQPGQVIPPPRSTSTGIPQRPGPGGPGGLPPRPGMGMGGPPPPGQPDGRPPLQRAPSNGPNGQLPPGPPMQRNMSLPISPPPGAGPGPQRQPSLPGGPGQPPYFDGPPSGPGPQRQPTLPGGPGQQPYRNGPPGPPGSSMQRQPPSGAGPGYPSRNDSLPPPPGGGPGGPPPPPNKQLGLPPNPMASRSTPTTPVGGSFPGGQGYPQPPAPPFASVPYRAPSDPSFQGGLRKATSSHSLHAQFDQRPASAMDAPPMPSGPGGFLPRRPSQSSLTGSFSAALPSERFLSRNPSMRQPFDDSPPGSPEMARQQLPPDQPVTSTVSASMKCKVFAKQHHAQWKSLGSAKLKLYRQDPGNLKQLVVEADDKAKTVLISTIVLTDGVERVGKTGVAVELSDRGARTGIVYMIQLRNETSAQGLYESLLAGSDRKAA